LKYNASLTNSQPPCACHVRTFITKKQAKRDTLADNRARGKAAEDQVRFEYEIQGYEMRKTHTGRDFVATRRDIISGKVVERWIVEVKSGNAQLSDRQQEKKKKGNYTVERRDPFFW
jgi:predicted Holliday junction resolvase-like endonuclease